MDRPDDPDIRGVLYRRIPNIGGKTKWDDAGNPTFGKSNFQDKDDALSVYIAAETTPERVLAGEKHVGFGIAWITTESIRIICKDNGISISRDPPKAGYEPEPGHVEVCGNVTDRLAKLLEKAAKWLDGYLPTRPPSGIS